MYQQTCHISQVFVHYMYFICLLVSGSKNLEMECFLICPHVKPFKYNCTVYELYV